jgi:hypothetical protein
MSRWPHPTLTRRVTRSPAKGVAEADLAAARKPPVYLSPEGLVVLAEASTRTAPSSSGSSPPATVCYQEERVL